MRKQEEHHELTGTLVYFRWRSMLRRCRYPSQRNFKYYGGRGIGVCDRWQRSLLAFVEDMGLPPSAQHSIERNDVNGNYCPENCVWMVLDKQNQNKRNSRRLTLGTQTLTLPQWAHRIGITPNCLRTRLDTLGWPLERALTTGPRRRVAQLFAPPGAGAFSACH